LGPGDRCYSVNRGDNACETKIQLSFFNSSLSARDARLSSLNLRFGPEIGLHGVIEFLLANGILFCERRVPRHIYLRLAQFRFCLIQIRSGLSKISFGLVERGLKGSRVYLEEWSPLPDKSTVGITLFKQKASDLGANLSVYKAIQCGDPFPCDWHILLHYFDDFDIGRASGRESHLSTPGGQHRADEENGRCRFHLLPSHHPRPGHAMFEGRSYFPKNFLHANTRSGKFAHLVECASGLRLGIQSRSGNCQK